MTNSPKKAETETIRLDLRDQVEAEILALPAGELSVLLHLARGMKIAPLPPVVFDSNLLPSVVPTFGSAARGALASTLASRMLLLAPREDTTMATWNDLIGPFYDTAALIDWLGVSKQAVSKRIGKTLLAVHSHNGDVRYPSFQFLDDGRVIPGLLKACKMLAEAGVDEWGQAQWVNTPVSQLGGRTVAETLASDRAGDVVAALNHVEQQAVRLAA